MDEEEEEEEEDGVEPMPEEVKVVAAEVGAMEDETDVETDPNCV
jgi:hypothetical protein